MRVANGVPLAAIGAREEVPPCCVTVISTILEYDASRFFMYRSGSIRFCWSDRVRPPV